MKLTSLIRLCYIYTPLLHRDEALGGECLFVRRLGTFTKTAPLRSPQSEDALQKNIQFRAATARERSASKLTEASQPVSGAPRGAQQEPALAQRYVAARADSPLLEAFRAAAD